MVTTAMAMARGLLMLMPTMARGTLRQLLWLLLSQRLLPSLATDTTAMVDTEAMAMADMVTTAMAMARGPLMLMPTTATEDTEDMVMDTAMDMVTAMAMATARDLRMPTTATEDMEDMVVDTAMATVMDTDTTDKKEGIAMMSR